MVGNWVNRQFQLDALGEALLLLLAAAAAHDHLDPDGLAGGGDRRRTRSRSAGARTTPAYGRSTTSRWTHSRLTCAAGLRAIGPDLQHASRQAADWSALADVIVADTAAHAVHPSGRWQRSAADDRAWTPRCCCRRSAGPWPPTTRAPSRRCAPTWPS